jgi:hypothetical protein
MSDNNSPIKINLDTKGILDLCKDELENVKKALYRSVNKLARDAEDHLVELVKSELNEHHASIFTGKKTSDGNFENIELSSPGPGIHILTIKEAATEIDNGNKVDMKTDAWLFGGDKVKSGKNGRYLVIPFKQGGKESKSTSDSAKFQNQLTSRVHEELALENKRRKATGESHIHFGGLERYKEDSIHPETKKVLHKKGDIMEGKLHDLKIFGGRERPHWSEGPLVGLAVHQKIQRDPVTGEPIKTKAGKVKATRSWMTFRVASESSKVNPETGTAPKDKFFYPAPKTKDFLERTGQWAEEEFDKNILPKIFEKWGDK